MLIMMLISKSDYVIKCPTIGESYRLLPNCPAILVMVIAGRVIKLLDPK
jgi:hypothetical protein